MKEQNPISEEGMQMKQEKNQLVNELEKYVKFKTELKK